MTATLLDRRLQQLCLTNPEVLILVTAAVRERFRAQPDLRMVDVSQNDCYNPCQCDQCQAIAKAEESEAGPLIWFVNQVADAVREEFPGRFVGTLAYQYTRIPPRMLVPRENVIVRLCSDGCCCSHPFDACSSKNNMAFVEDIKAWQSKTRNLFIWDYTTNFAHYIQPFPNLYSLQPNIQFLVAHGARGIFAQGNYHGAGHGEMAALRTYLLARIMWKPDCNIVQEIAEFTDAHYGPAAKHIRKYIHYLHGRVGPEEHIGSTYPATGPFFGGDFTRRANAILAKAQKAVQDDPERLLRVKEFRMPVYYVEMMSLPGLGPIPDDQRGKIEGAAREFFEIAKTLGISHAAETKEMLALQEEYTRKLLATDAYRDYETVMLLPTEWLFRFDPDNVGEQQQWYGQAPKSDTWRKIKAGLPWEEQFGGYNGVAWYQTQISIPRALHGRTLLLGFDAVDETAVVYVNGQKAGAFGVLGVTWDTPFTVDITPHVSAGASTTIAVRVEDSGGPGGIWKTVRLLSPRK